MSSINAAHIEYVRTLLRELGLSPSALAKKAKIASTTLTRALNDPDHKFALSSTTIEKIAAATGVSPAPFLQDQDFTDIARGPVSKDSNRKQWSTFVLGEAKAGMWLEPALVSLEEHPPLPITYKGREHHEVFALKIGDRSAENFAREGDFVVCVKLEDSYRFDPGDRVIIERRRDGGTLVEITLRQLTTINGKWALQFDTSDPKFAGLEPIVADLDAEEVKIIGVVHFALRFALAT